MSVCKFQFLTALAYITVDSGGASIDQRIVRHVLCHNGTGSHKGILADIMAADDGGIGTHTGTLFQGRLAVLALALNKGPGVDHVGKHAGGAQKNAVFADNAGIYRHIVLDLDAFSQHHTGRNYHILADVAVLANSATLHHMGEMPDLGAFPDLAALIHITGFMNKIVLLHYRASSTASMTCCCSAASR